MKKLLMVILFALGPLVIFAQSSNVGIIQGIWFSENNYFSEDVIRIYTAVQNNTGDDIEGNVEFFDNGILLGTKSFTSINSRIAEVWIDTIATKGKHQFSVKITELVKNKPGEAKEIIIARIIESEDVLVIDDDSDGDGIGNEEDEDDDNDGYSDKEEKRNNSDPLDSESTPLQEEVADNMSSGDGVIYKPNFILELEETYPEILKITDPINNLQNRIIPNIKKEIERIELQKEDKNTFGNKEDSKQEELDGLVSEKTNNSFNNVESGIDKGKSFALTIYEIILFGITWVFSCLVCTIALLFIGIYLILKILFYLMRVLFGRRE